MYCAQGGHVRVGGRTYARAAGLQHVREPVCKARRVRREGIQRVSPQVQVCLPRVCTAIDTSGCLSLYTSCFLKLDASPALTKLLMHFNSFIRLSCSCTPQSTSIAFSNVQYTFCD